MPRQLIITVMSGPEDGFVFPSVDAPAICGRVRGTAQIVIRHDAIISRQHARINVRANKIVVRDLNSTNGVYLSDGTKLEGETTAEPGTLFKIGRTWIKADIAD